MVTVDLIYNNNFCGWERGISNYLCVCVITCRKAISASMPTYKMGKEIIEVSTTYHNDTLSDALM